MYSLFIFFRNLREYGKSMGLLGVECVLKFFLQCLALDLFSVTS